MRRHNLKSGVGIDNNRDVDRVTRDREAKRRELAIDVVDELFVGIGAVGTWPDLADCGEVSVDLARERAPPGFMEAMELLIRSAMFRCRICRWKIAARTSGGTIPSKAAAASSPGSPKAW